MLLIIIYSGNWCSECVLLIKLRDWDQILMKNLYDPKYSRDVGWVFSNYVLITVKIVDFVEFVHITKS